MTIKECIFLLNPITTSDAIAEIKYKYGFRGEVAAVQKFEKACKTACKIMEKQLPKKVTHEATLAKYCTCPSCGNVIDKYDYCHFCGQALDWSNESPHKIVHESLCETETYINMEGAE